MHQLTFTSCDVSCLPGVWNSSNSTEYGCTHSPSSVAHNLKNNNITSRKQKRIQCAEKIRELQGKGNRQMITMKLSLIEKCTFFQKSHPHRWRWVWKANFCAHSAYRRSSKQTEHSNCRCSPQTQILFEVCEFAPKILLGKPFPTSHMNITIIKTF